ncbi:PilW family protein [Duganella sp. CT11-25]|uniref:PilW family protein n=1 Tax=unclassified Duganella TaxID=2636909 RepID=UPI0039AFC188
MKRGARGGWSVVEFMIAVALGLLITLLASGLFLASGSNYRNHSENMWLSDGGRYALQSMAQAIRQSATVNWESDGAPFELNPETPAAIDGRDASSISRASDGISAPLPPVANGSDVLALRFSGSGGGANGDGSSLNCAGFGVAAPADADARGWSIFYVAADAGGEPELRCKYRGGEGWGADAIVRGVDSFQVLYGVDTDTPMDGVPNTYLNASAVRALDDALALEGATPAELARDRHRKTHWKRVCSVKLALLLHGDSNSRADTVQTRFDLFGPAYSDAHGEDQGVLVQEGQFPQAQRYRARRVFSMTVALRNRGV